MKDNIRHSLMLAVSVFLILLLSSSASAFPSMHSSEAVLQNWTFGSRSSANSYMSAGQFYSPTGKWDDPYIGPLYFGDQDPAAAVPEPATVALMLVGLSGLVLLQWHRRNKTA